MSKNPPKYLSTTNACKLCAPLGAALAFKGMEGAVPFLHGSQGCATYMRRYIISHFNEPIDIAPPRPWAKRTQSTVAAPT